MNELMTFSGKQFLQKSSVIDVSQGPAACSLQLY